jgi:hypothetical protein
MLQSYNPNCFFFIELCFNIIGHESLIPQFEHINNNVIDTQERSNPAVSVDSKKKENIWNYKNNCREYS